LKLLMSEGDTWSTWENQIVNGLFPLRHFLGRSNHSVVFQTEHRAQKAAIKLLPADPATADTQLAQWQSLSALSHPHLIRILDTGRCKLGGHPFLFVVTEFAEQTLAQILPHRALSVDETQGLVGPTLAALTYLHGKNLVQAQLKPPNFLVVDDQLKLASDTIRTIGDGPLPGAKPSVYDAPEARTVALETASDSWGFAVTLVEALTQAPPKWHNDKSGEILLPPSIPADFADILRRCLNRNPAVRPTIAEMQARLVAPPEPEAPPEVAEAAAEPTGYAIVEPVQQAELPLVTPVPAPAARIAAPPTASHQPSPSVSPEGSRWLAPAAAVGLAVLILIWVAVRYHGRHESPPVVSANPPAASPSSAVQATPASAPAPLAKPTTPASNGVVHQEIPVASRSARDSIHGTIKVAVLVNVDHSGNVVSESLETHGPSRYFAHLSADAAKKWRFAPTDTPGTRQWSLQFEYSRSGAQTQIEPRVSRPAK
jgi:outer membrane biosynthesis protein TonB